MNCRVNFFLFKNKFRHTGFTESSESLGKQHETIPTSQNTHKPSFHKSVGFRKVAKKNGSGVHGVHFFHHEAPKTKHQICARSPLVNFGLISRPMFC